MLWLLALSFDSVGSIGKEVHQHLSKLRTVNLNHEPVWTLDNDLDTGETRLYNGQALVDDRPERGALLYVLNPRLISNGIIDRSDPRNSE